MKERTRKNSQTMQLNKQQNKLNIQRNKKYNQIKEIKI